MEERNYIKEYYQNHKENKNSTFFKELNENSTDDDINTIRKELKSLELSINEKNKELMNLYSSKYSNNYDVVDTYFKYETRTGATFYFSASTGTTISEIPEKSLTFTLDTKTGEVLTIAGFLYEQGSMILKKYKYSINIDNSAIKLTLIGEAICDILDSGKVINAPYNKIHIYDTDIWNWRSNLKVISGKDFINKMLNMNREMNITLEDIKNGFQNNRSAEIILKEAPDKQMKNLLARTITETQPIYKLLNLEKTTYNMAKEKNCIEDIIELSYFMNLKDVYHKTDEEWFDLMDKMKKYEEDFEFYHIDISLPMPLKDEYHASKNRMNVIYKNKLLALLAYCYITSSRYNLEPDNTFSKYYSFGKFCEYVVNETINQGYTEIALFITELRDYLKMCEQLDITPTLYSSYLKQTHDITSRNHRIAVSEHEDELFKNIYKPIKTMELENDYHIVKPITSKDIQREGDNLNHCVASYIKRVIDGETIIMFLRKVVNESLITLEIRNNKIVQARGMHNRKPTNEEIKAIAEYAKKAKLECSYA